MPSPATAKTPAATMRVFFVNMRPLLVFRPISSGNLVRRFTSTRNFSQEKAERIREAVQARALTVSKISKINSLVVLHAGGAKCGGAGRKRCAGAVVSLY